MTAYLELAELQALNRKPMYMKDWIERLDDFLKLTGNEILQHAGKVSHQKALQKASEEYEKYKKLNRDEISEVEKHFIKQIEQTVQRVDPKKKNNR